MAIADTDPTPLPIAQGLLYDVQTPIQLSQYVDVPNQYVCDHNANFRFSLAQDAHVTLKFYKLTTSGPSAFAITHTDRRGLITTTTYDAENRPLTVMRDGLTTSITTYDADGHVATISDALQRTTTNHYDEAGRHTEEDQPLGAVRTWTYTPLNDVATATDADGRTTTHTYTPRRYLQSTSNAAGETTTTSYDGEGHPTSITHPNGSVWSYAYDAADRLASVTDPLHAKTSYGYDLDGNRTRQTDANGHLTTLSYDADHRHTGTTTPSGVAGPATSTWTYDADGNLASELTPNGHTRTRRVDALNRVTSESTDAAQGCASAAGAGCAGAAGNAPNEITATTWHHDGNGNVVVIDETLSSGVRHATRRYDAFDRLEHDVDVHGKTVDVTYDAVGNRTGLTDADGGTTNWTFDALNHNTSVTVPGQGTTSLTYYPTGLAKTVVRPDGSSTTTSYDLAGRIAGIVHAKGGSELAHESYTYDLDGNRITQKESNGAVTGNQEQTTTYTYDTADRLTDVQAPDRTTHYVLDAAGNRTQEQITDTQQHPIGNSTLSYDARDELIQRDDSISDLHITLAYDLDGNTLSQTDASGTRSFGYDSHDRVLTLNQPGQLPLTFDYQSDGQRIAKHQGNTETRYQYDQNSLLAETNAIGNTLTRYHYSATQLISRSEAGSTPTYRHYLLDALKTPIALLTQDGAISARTSYDPWGEIIAQQGIGGAVTTPNRDGTNAELPSTDQQDVGYTGYLKDTESGLYYAKARYYDPRVARFTTQDPEDGKAMQPPSLHRYLYAYANPTIYTDPTGRIEELARAADYMGNASDWLRDLAGQQPHNAFGNTVAALGPGIGRGVLGLTEGSLRLVNAVANTATVASASVPNAVGYLPSYAEGPAKEMAGTEQALRDTASYLGNGGARQSYGRAVADTANAFSGDDPAASSDIGAVVSSLVAPTRAASATLEEASITARQVALDAVTQAQQAAQQVKNTAQSAWRVVEGSGSGGADLVPVSSTVARGLGDATTSPWLADKRAGIRVHLEEFRDGASYLLPESAYKNYVRGKQFVGDPSGQFATTARTLDKVLADANGNLSVAKERLGIPPEFWNEQMYRVDVPSPLQNNARFPSGLERGANKYFRWGGYTSGGLPEIVFDQVPADQVTITPTNLRPSGHE